MNYKEPSFELDERQISFKNTAMIPIISATLVIPIFTGLINSHHNYMLIATSLLGVIIALFAFRYFTGSLLKTKIQLSDISHIEMKPYKKTDGKLSFKGTGSVKTFFPSGLDQSKTENVFLLHQKNKKAIIGFTPNNCSETIAALKQNNIKVIEY